MVTDSWKKVNYYKHIQKYMTLEIWKRKLIKLWIQLILINVGIFHIKVEFKKINKLKNLLCNLKFSDFIRAAHKRKIVKEKDLLEYTFRALDSVHNNFLYFFSTIYNNQDGNGHISISELKEQFGNKLSDEKWKEII